jgi:hypothetical protein
MRQSHPPDSRLLVPAVRHEGGGSPAGVEYAPTQRRPTRRTIGARRHSQKQLSRTCRTVFQQSGCSTLRSRLVGLGWRQPICRAPLDLGPQQLSSFFPVPASVFQIQSVFAPTHEPSVICWPPRSDHPVYLRGKIHHCSDPQSVVNGCLPLSVPG